MYLVQHSVFQIMFIFNLYVLLSCYHEGKLQLLAIYHRIFLAYIVIITLYQLQLSYILALNLLSDMHTM